MILDFLFVLALATFRLSNMLADTNQSGPWGVLDRVRALAGVRFDEYSQPYGATGLAEGMLCVYCNSVWFGFGFALLYALAPLVAFWIALPFALSAASVFLDKFIKKE